MFALVALIFSALFWDRYIDEDKPTDGGVVGSVLSALELQLFVGMSAIVFLVLIYSLYSKKRLYLYIFIASISVVTLYNLGSDVLKEINRTKTERDRLYETKANKIFDQIKRNVHDEKNVEYLLDSIKQSTKNIESQKTAIYLILASKSDENKSAYFNKINLVKEKNSLKSFMDYMFDIYDFASAPEEEILRLFEILREKDSTQFFEKAIPYRQRKAFSFEGFVGKTYYRAALDYLSFLEFDTEEATKHLNVAKHIKDENIKSKTISKILGRTNDFFDCISTISNNCLYIVPMVLAIKDEKHFQKYLGILKERLKKELVKIETVKTRINQKEQKDFMEMYHLLGEEHPFIRLFPKNTIEIYMEMEKEIIEQGRDNYIAFHGFLAQVVWDINHSHAYDREWYRIYRKGKLVHVDRTNRYGCMTYKAYGARPDDIIEIDAALFGKWKQKVGWISLLPAWDTPRGMSERSKALGLDLGDFSMEQAIKVKKDFELYYDMKWCE